MKTINYKDIKEVLLHHLSVMVSQNKCNVEDAKKISRHLAFEKHSLNNKHNIKSFFNRLKQLYPQVTDIFEVMHYKITEVDNKNIEQDKIETIRKTLLQK